jgi:chromosome segregation ATPase
MTNEQVVAELNRIAANIRDADTKHYRDISDSAVCNGTIPGCENCTRMAAKRVLARSYIRTAAQFARLGRFIEAYDIIDEAQLVPGNDESAISAAYDVLANDTYEQLRKQTRALQEEPTDEQRADWAHGNAAISNPDVTKEMSELAIERKRVKKLEERLNSSRRMVTELNATCDNLQQQKEQLHTKAEELRIISDGWYDIKEKVSDELDIARAKIKELKKRLVDALAYGAKADLVIKSLRQGEDRMVLELVDSDKRHVALAQFITSQKEQLIEAGGKITVLQQENGVLRSAVEYLKRAIGQVAE